MFGVLKILEKTAFATADIFDVFTSGYADSYKKMRGVMHGHKNYHESLVEKLKENQKFYNLIFRLQKQGLVIKQKKNNQSFWAITKSGKEYLNKLKKQLPMRPPKINYKASAVKKLNIVSFDVPECYRPKRDWIRDSLKNMGYQMVQKSVWIGKNELPEEFIKDLRKFNLISYVEIFGINKRGTLDKTDL